MRIINNLSSVLKIFVLISFGVLSNNVYAEYYLVFSDPEPNVIWLYRSPPKHTYHKHYRKISYQPYHRRSSCHISIYYVYPQPMFPIYPYEGVIVEYREPRYEYVKFSHKIYRYRKEVYKEDRYDPDMSTGDDDASVYPELNIDR